ncbi:MAG: hypothetical protein GQ471_02985, partial [Nitrosopumilus sp.]|nr:hypothetical protein [Nitrosopumilus sp.]
MTRYFLAIILSLIFVFSGFTISDVLATQYPGIVVAVEADPYYWSENGFGLEIVEEYGAPNPYLTSGVTDSSTPKEIMDAFRENANATITSPADDSDRVISIIVHIANAEFFDDESFYTFSSYVSSETSGQFTLESLPSKDKESFYDFISRFVNPGKIPDPFDVGIDLVTGDGTILQRIQYFDCKITNFQIYRMENELNLLFLEKFGWEIRDHTEFECESNFLISDFSSPPDPYVNIHGIGALGNQTAAKQYYIPKDDDRVLAYGVSLIGSEIPEELSFHDFPKFSPIGSSIPEELGGANKVPDSLIPKFYLEGLVSKDKKPLYEYIARYFNPGKTPEPFDVNVDHITGDGTILITFQYFDCQPTTFYTYGLANMGVFHFTSNHNTEIRDHIEFECDGFHFTTQLNEGFSPYVNLKEATLSYITNGSANTVPSDNDRVMDYVVHFTDGDFADSPLTLPTFSRLDQTGITSFDLGSLPSKEKERFYKLLVGPSVDPGRVPLPFDVQFDLVAGDGDIIIKYDYSDCKVIDYRQFLMENLLVFKFDYGFTPEIRDRTSFDCNGFNMESNFEKTISPFVNIEKPEQAIKNTLDSLNISSDLVGFNQTSEGTIIPTQDSRVTSFMVHLTGRDIPDGMTINTYSSFIPVTPTIVDESLIASDKRHEFILRSLVSTDKVEFYEIAAKIFNPGKSPEPIDVQVNAVTGDGTILQSWQYFDCEIIEFTPQDDESLLTMKYHGKANGEIRELSKFSCDGFHLNVEDGESFSPYV